MITSDNSHQRIGQFLTNYSTALLEFGATTIRIDKNVMRLAKAFDCHAELSIYPRHVEVSLLNEADGSHWMMSKMIGKAANNYQAIAELSRLSWNCYDHSLPLEDAEKRFNEIISTPRLPIAIVITLTALANASFCRLFNGDYTAMAIVLIATACGFLAKHLLIKQWHTDSRIAVIASSCLSSIISCSGYIFNVSATPDVALATSVLYLVPGIPYLNSISDLINGHYICAISRALVAGIITICLASGLYIGLSLMNARIL